MIFQNAIDKKCFFRENQTAGFRFWTELTKKEFFVKRIYFYFVPVFLLWTSLFLLVGCDGKSEMAIAGKGGTAASGETGAAVDGKDATAASGGSETAVNLKKQYGIEAREIFEATETDASVASRETTVKPKELDDAVEALVQKTLKENPELAKLEAPIQMTYFFIRALQTNNAQAIRGMLTTDAYREMENLKGMPCPSFIQNSEVELGNVQYLTEEDDESKVVGARVGTTWLVKSQEGETREDIAWVFRFEDDAWLVAGMISILDPKYPPILINFEDLKETEANFASIEKEVERINMENSGQSASVPKDEDSDQSATAQKDEDSAAGK